MSRWICVVCGLIYDEALGSVPVSAQTALLRQIPPG